MRTISANTALLFLKAILITAAFLPLAHADSIYTASCIVPDVEASTVSQVFSDFSGASGGCSVLGDGTYYPGTAQASFSDAWSFDSSQLSSGIEVLAQSVDATSLSCPDTGDCGDATATVSVDLGFVVATAGSGPGVLDITPDCPQYEEQNGGGAASLDAAGTAVGCLPESIPIVLGENLAFELTAYATSFGGYDQSGGGQGGMSFTASAFEADGVTPATLIAQTPEPCTGVLTGLAGLLILLRRKPAPQMS